MHEENSKDMAYVLKLYVAGDTPLSAYAIKNLQEIAERFLTEQDTVEVIDIVESPGQAIEQKIIITPTLIKVQPAPQLRIVGDLSHIDHVVAGLGLKSGH